MREVASVCLLMSLTYRRHTRHSEIKLEKENILNLLREAFKKRGKTYGIFHNYLVPYREI